jgi:PAS domain S-box-containing protein
MKNRKPVIAAAFAHPVDRELAAGCLSGLGYELVEFPKDSLPAADLFILDVPSARRLGPQVIALKKETEVFLPAMIALGRLDPVDPWLAAGFDDSLRMPFTKAHLKANVAILLRLRHQSLELAQKGEEKYRAIFEATGTATLLVKEDTTILMANQECLRVTGYTPDELIGTKWTAYVAPESLDELLAYHQARREDPEKAPHPYEARLVDKAGRVRTASLSVGLVPGTRQSIVSMADITERRQAEEATARIAREWQSTFDAANDAIWVLDREQRVLRSNKIAEQIFQRPCDEMIGNHCWEMVHGTQEPIPECPLLRVKKSLRRETMELRIGKRWYQIAVDPILDAVGRFNGAVHIVSDITARKEAEKAVRENERRLATLMANLPGMVYRCQNRPDWPMNFVSEGCASLTGWPVSALIQNRPAYGELIVETDRQPVWDAVQEALKDRRFYEFTYRIQTADGQLRWVWERGCGVFAPDGSLLYLEGFITDITERKEAEEALRESQEHLARIVESVPSGITIINREGQITFANPAAEAILRLTRSKIIERHYNDADWRISAVDGSPFPDEELPFVRVMQTGQPVYDVQHAIEHPDGQRVMLSINAAPVKDASNQVVGMIAAITDITERKRAEAELQRLTMAIEQTGEAILVTDPEGTIQYVNPAFEAVTGYTRREVIGQNPRLLKSGKQDEAFYRNLWETITGGRMWQGRFVNQRKDGTLYTEDATISPVKDASGRIVSFVAVKRDITEHLRISQDQARLQEQLQQAQKMESIGRLAGGVAHDFNNMLSIILGYGDIVLQKLHPGDPLRDGVEEILKAGRRSADLTRQLLAFSRKQTLQPEILSLNEIVRNIEKMLRRLIGEDIALVLSLSEGLPRVKVDPGQIEQVIVNLAVNARDAMPLGGKLLIETSQTELDEAYAANHPSVAPGKYVMLAVTDRGCGMDKHVLAQIFDPFFTTKEKGKGTGLGLATVYGIIKQSGGNIWAYSEPGQGTTFKIYLPVTGEKAEALAKEAAQEEPAGGSDRILVVEDEVSLRKLLEGFLSRSGYQVTSVANGGEALLLVEEKGLEFDLVITDVVMPGMSGSVLSERLRRKQPGLKVLFMSGYTDDAIAHHGVLDQGTPFIQKPFALHDFANKIREVLGSSPPPFRRGGVPAESDHMPFFS